MKKHVCLFGLFVVAVAVGLLSSSEAQAPPASPDPRVMVEGYYKIMPGRVDEWLELYRAQHLPVLKEREHQGQILQIVIYRPFLHQGAPEWDFKVILTYRDFVALGDRAGFEAIERRLYKDWEAHEKAERRRWEITEKHWDDIMVVVPPE